MFNDNLGERRFIDGMERFVSYPTAYGCALYGPYEWRTPGHYLAEFDVALAAPPIGTNQPSLYLDVAASAGSVALSNRIILASELKTSIQTFELKFTILDNRQLEFRAHVPANGAVIISPARVSMISEISEDVHVDVAAASDDPFFVSHQVRSVLRLLRPYRAIGVAKTRLGNISDGGYICLDDFEGVDVALSFGINDDISWDRDAADRGLTIYQFDHTVDNPAPDDNRFVFHRKMIAPDRGSDRETINDLLNRHDNGLPRPNVMLKMDIENAEWAALLATDDALLGRFSQIVCELHYFQGLIDPAHRVAVFDTLTRLSKYYAVVHIHANNYAGWCQVANIVIPCVMEVTFANRAIFALEPSDEVFPTSLDASCDPSQPDMFLGTFRF